MTSGYPSLSILLLENKDTGLDTRTTTLNQMEIENLIRGNNSAAAPLPYFRFGCFRPEEDARDKELSNKLDHEQKRIYFRSK